MSGKRILVVDDSVLIQKVLSDAFTPAGYEVVTAGDGAEALARVEERAPDLIIADILMPVMDGWALCDEVRRRPATRDTPFIFLTTERDVPKRIKGLEAGADDYVCKPFSKEELLARAEAVLRRSAGDRPPPETASAGARLAGHTDHIPMADLLQTLSANSRTGTLHLWGESVARIFFRDGQVINAEIQGLKGAKALYRIVAWPAARFEFEPGEPARVVDAAITGSTSTVLMECFAHLDELRDLIAALPPADSLMRVPDQRAAAPDPGDLSTTQRLILLKAAGRGATLREIVDGVPDKDLEAFAAVSDLLRRGLLVAGQDTRR